MNVEGQIDYIEIPVTDLQKTRNFFEDLYGWMFQEWGLSAACLASTS